MTQKTKSKENKIKNHFGIANYFKWYNDNHECKVSRQEFNEICGEFNLGIINLMLNENVSYTPPMVGFTFSIRKNERIPKIKNGKLVNKLPVNFKETLKLWSLDEEAKKNKILVRHTNTHSNRCVFSIRIIKTGNVYANKKYYLYKPSRMFQRSLAARIFDETKKSFDTNNLY